MFVIFNKTQYIKLFFPTKWKPEYTRLCEVSFCAKLCNW